MRLGLMDGWLTEGQELGKSIASNQRESVCLELTEQGKE